ncbi:MAG: YhfC family intramembrane metalloprotease, partial [Lachnospiraceae bacterium]|nr:YhfC family intramembrane metalloprotease [Lachnospiraceae bacterium]
MLAAGLLFGSFICFVLPIGGAVVLMRRKKGAGKTFLFGMLAFIVSQLLLRLPLLQLVLPQYAWFAVLQLDPWRYGLFLGLTAGLFEETARWIAIRFFLKEKTNIE